MSEVEIEAKTKPTNVEEPPSPPVLNLDGHCPTTEEKKVKEEKSLVEMMDALEDVDPRMHKFVGGSLHLILSLFKEVLSEYNS